MNLITRACAGYLQATLVFVTKICIRSTLSLLHPTTPYEVLGERYEKNQG